MALVSTCPAWVMSSGAPSAQVMRAGSVESSVPRTWMDSSASVDANYLLCRALSAPSIVIGQTHRSMFAHPS